jgi:hypothetical protein
VYIYHLFDLRIHVRVWYIKYTITNQIISVWIITLTLHHKLSKFAENDQGIYTVTLIHVQEHEYDQRIYKNMHDNISNMIYKTQSQDYGLYQCERTNPKT